MDDIRFPPEAQGPFEQAFHVLAIGRGRLTASHGEHCDNRTRLGPSGLPAAVFQCGLGGRGWYADRQGRRELHGRGQALCLRLPSACSYGNETGHDWQRIWLTLGGGLAIDAVQALIDQGGPCFVLPRGGAVLEGLIALHRECPRLESHHINARAFAILAGCADGLAPGDRDHPAPVVAALALLRRRIDDPTLGLDDLACAAGLSRHHFSRIFTASVGTSPIQHLIGRRLRRAANMLRHSDLGVKQIASACGYASRQRFSAAFTQTYGCSPATWRRDAQGL